MENKGKTSSITDGQKLKNYLSSVPKGEYSWTKQKLIRSCKVDLHTFNNWLYDRCRIPELAKEKIEETIGAKIFEQTNTP